MEKQFGPENMDRSGNQQHGLKIVLFLTHFEAMILATEKPSSDKAQFIRRC